VTRLRRMQKHRRILDSIRAPQFPLTLHALLNASATRRVKRYENFGKLLTHTFLRLMKNKQQNGIMRCSEILKMDNQQTLETKSHVCALSLDMTGNCMICAIERERDEAREVASGLSIQEERVNEAQKELSSIHRWIDKNHADGFIDSLTYLQNLERVADNWYDRIDAIETDARRFVRERDEAKEQIKELIYIAERAIALAEIDFENDKFGVVSELRSDLEKVKEATQ